MLVESARGALRTLKAQRLRSFLTLFGLVWGTASVIFLLAWGRGVQEMMEDGMTRAGKNLVQVSAGQIGEDFTPAADRRWLWFTRDDVRGLRRATRFADLVLGESRDYRIASFGAQELSLEVRGVEPSQGELRGVRLASGRGISEPDIARRSRVAVLGHETRRQLLGPGGRVGDSIRLNGRSFEVVGVLEPVGTQFWRDGEELDDQIWIPLATHIADGPVYARSLGIVQQIVMRIEDREYLEDFKSELRAVLSRRLRVSASDEEALAIHSPIDALNKFPVDAMRFFLFVLGATTLLVGGIGVLTMMLDAVQERRSEIGVRLAVGARRRDILQLFFLETLAITVVGGVLGLALGVGGCQVLEGLETDSMIPLPILSADVIALATLSMTSVGILSGVIPAWRASRVDPAVILREE